MASSSRIGILIFGNKNARISLDVFLDLQCPFSKKAWITLRNFPNDLENIVAVRVHMWIQPWHGFSHYLTKASLAVLNYKHDNGLKFIDEVYSLNERFKDDDHKSPQDLYDELKLIASDLGMPKEDFRHEVTSAIGHSGLVTKQIKLFTKFGRQNGIHASPTFLVNGLEYANASSSWTVEEWVNFLNTLNDQN